MTDREDTAVERVLRSVESAGGAVLPSWAKRVLRPSFDCVAHALLSRRTDGFVYDHDRYIVEHTPMAVASLYGFVSDAQTTEGVPLEYLDTDAELIVDVGAHFGGYTLVLSRLNPSADIVAFEPNAYNRDALRSFLRVNDVDATIRSEVVKEKTGETSFYLDPAPGSESHSTTRLPKSDRVEVPCVALSDVIDEHDAASVFVKIDAEGAERTILDDLLTAECDMSGLVEVHPDKLVGSGSSFTHFLTTHCSSVEFIGDTSPDHDKSRRINHEHNRPMFYFEV